MRLMRVFRRARLDETRTVVDLVQARAAWLRNRGLDQWGSLDPARHTPKAVTRGEVWGLVLDGRIVGTITITTVAPADLWTHEECADTALYLSKMATWPDSAGAGLGRVLLDSAIRYAADNGIPRLRWDAWRTNPALHRYYVTQGARHLRTVDTVNGRNSGALFESAFQVPSDTATRIDAPDEVVVVLNGYRQCTSTGWAIARESHIGWASPADHWHGTPDLKYGNLGTPLGGLDHGPAMLDSDAKGGPTLFNSGAGWRAALGTRTQPATGPALDHLRTGHVYRLRHVTGSPGECQLMIMGDHLGGPAEPGEVERTG